MRKLHAASAQVNSIAMDPKGNLEKIRKQALCASIVGADAIVFAETAIHAYCLFPENLAQAEPVGGPLTGQILEWAKEYSIIIMAGFLEKSELGIHNSHVIARPDGSMFSVRKNGLTPTELNAGLIAGKIERDTFEINGVKCALYICADSGVAAIQEDMKKQGVEMLFVGTAGGGWRKDYITEADLDTPEGLLEYIDDHSMVHLTEAVRPKRSHTTAFAAANAMGDDGAYMTHHGHCMIIDRHRIIRAQIPGTNVMEHMLDQMIHAVLYF